jgi:HEPN domain-containing protein
MTDADTFSDEIFEFHAQQSVEKNLKAWITLLGGTFAFTHDLRMLLLTLRDLGSDIEPLKPLIELNVFAVQFRYEPMETLTGRINRGEMLAMVEAVHRIVEKVIQLRS